MFEYIMSYFCMGFLAGIVVAMFFILVSAIIKINKEKTEEKAYE